jgi:glycerate kinase
MKIVVAPQEFKGSLSAVQAAQAMAEGLGRALPDATLELVPMADGGPGTVEAVVAAAKNGRRMTAAAHDALGRPLQAAWGIIDDGTAVIEMAAASGLTLLAEDERDARIASTYGTGELVRAVLDAGCARIIVGIGGSSTNDGGAGMAQALGARLLDDAGQDLPPGGAALARLDRIDLSGLDPRLGQCRVLAATDVFNGLCGPEGASLLYGPQKGATPEVAQELDAALRRYAQVIERDLGMSVLDLPGAGAAGGLGAGLAAFLGAELVLGSQLVAEAVGLKQKLEGADLALTGEGRLDAQTSFGKAPWEVARLAKDCGLPVIAIAGSLADDRGPALGEAFDAVVAVTPRAMSVGEAMAQGAKLVADAAEGVARLLLVGGRLGRR